MKPGMIRWKVRPSKNRPLVHCPDSRSTYFFVPSAKPTKFSTVLGAWNGYRSRVMAPLLVWRVVLSWSATGGSFDGEGDGDRAHPPMGTCRPARRGRSIVIY